MVNHMAVSKEDLAATSTQAFRAAKELYRCERVFLLQPERVVLDEQYQKLRSESRRLVGLLFGTGRQSERARVDDLLHEQLRLIGEFRAGIEAALEIRDYTSYRSNY